jgi:predicted enzyme related to lactoylglutathione lyase
MPRVDRRNALRMGAASMTIPVAAFLTPGSAQSPQGSRRNAMEIHFLELVTPDVDSACDLYSMMYGITFGDPIQELGGARTADLDGGGMLGVRAPLRDTETPVVRPYVLVDDIGAAVSAATEAGAEIAITPTEIAGYGQFAIIIHGGIESGLWQI